MAPIVNPCLRPLIKLLRKLKYILETFSSKNNITLMLIRLFCWQHYITLQYYFSGNLENYEKFVSLRASVRHFWHIRISVFADEARFRTLNTSRRSRSTYGCWRCRKGRVHIFFAHCTPTHNLYRFEYTFRIEAKWQMWSSASDNAMVQCLSASSSDIFRESSRFSDNWKIYHSISSCYFLLICLECLKILRCTTNLPKKNNSRSQSI